TLVAEPDETNSSINHPAAQVNIDEPAVLDETLHLHDVEAACPALQVAESGEEQGQHDDADANRANETENLVESGHASGVGYSFTLKDFHLSGFSRQTRNQSVRVFHCISYEHRRKQSSQGDGALSPS